MFTGLIEAVGEIAGARVMSGGWRELEIAAPGLEEIRPGDSVAVNGTCVTAEKVLAGRFTARLTPQTAQVTTLGKLQRGTRVNLERALRLGDRMGGHFVQGHVDTIGEVRAVSDRGE